jgi:hypothetical protein
LVDDNGHAPPGRTGRRRGAAFARAKPGRVEPAVETSLVVSRAKNQPNPRFRALSRHLIANDRIGAAVPS